MLSAGETAQPTKPVLTVERHVALDGLRGVAAVLVVLGHVGQTLGTWQPPFFYLAVDLFFILSGFVLALNYDARFTSGLGTFAFLRMRAARLMPLAAVGAAVGLLGQAIAPRTHLSAALAVASSLSSAFALPTFGSVSPHLLFPLNVPLWSLFFELWVANMVFALGWRRFNGPALPVLIVVSALGLLVSQRQFHSLDLGWSWEGVAGGICRVLFGFFVGVWIARRRGRAESGWTSPAIACLLMLTVLITLPVAGKASQLAALFYIFLGLPVIVVIGARSDGSLTSLSRRLGDASYAIYVVHQPIISIAHDLAPQLGTGPVWAIASFDLIFVVVLLGLGLTLDRYYDLPLRRWLSRSGRGFRKAYV